MITTEDLPKEWIDVIDKLAYQTYSIPILAGGALRDLSNSKPIKDVDIFLPYITQARFKCLREDTKFYLNWEWRSTWKESTDDDGELISHIRLKSVWEVKIPSQNWVYNIIELAEKYTTSELLSTFDFGLCQIGYDYKAKSIVGSSNFYTDYSNKTLTLVNKGTEHMSVEKRLPRLKAKYSDYEVIL